MVLFCKIVLTREKVSTQKALPWEVCFRTLKDKKPPPQTHINDGKTKRAIDRLHYFQNIKKLLYVLLRRKD